MFDFIQNKQNDADKAVKSLKSANKRISDLENENNGLVDEIMRLDNNNYKLQWSMDALQHGKENADKNARKATWLEVNKLELELDEANRKLNKMEKALNTANARCNLLSQNSTDSSRLLAKNERLEKQLKV